MPGLGDVVQRFRVDGTEHEVIVAKQGIKPREGRHTPIQVSLEKSGTFGDRSISVRTLAAGRETIHGVFVRRKPLGRLSEFTETLQASNFAGRKSHVHLHPPLAEIEPRRNPGQKADHQHTHENCGTDRRKAAATLHQCRHASQK